MLYPSSVVISYIGPSIWLPCCEVSTKAPSVRPRDHLVAYNKEYPLIRSIDHVGNLHCLSFDRHNASTGKLLNLAKRRCSHDLPTWSKYSLGLRPTLPHRVLRRRHMAGLLYDHQSVVYAQRNRSAHESVQHRPTCRCHVVWSHARWACYEHEWYTGSSRLALGVHHQRAASAYMIPHQNVYLTASY